MGTINRRVAKTVLRIAEGRNPLANRILDRTVELCESVALQTIRQTKFGWPGRRPRMSRVHNGKSDMDLFSFLVPLLLSPNQTVIELPDYKSRLPRRTFAEERHLGSTRFGVLSGLVSHRSFLSFSVKMRDQTVAVREHGSESDSLGSERTFMLVDYNGVWQPGFAGIAWQPGQAESEFRTRYRLATPGTKDGFAYYVHPNRRESIFGAPYLLLKLLSMRIEDELEFCRSEQKRLHVTHASGSDARSDGRTIVDVGPRTGVMMPTFTVELRGTKFRGAYAPFETSDAGRAIVRGRIQFLANRLRPLVQFIVRADEVAFYTFGRTNDYVAPWIKGAPWEHVRSNDPYRSKAHFSFTNELCLSYKTDMVSQEVAA